ncbi:MAG TPA: dehydrogenase [Bacteroidia bacterium]|nr:dehydrogenase [Bacteroidia bacterium]HRH08118.1 dehydrogenase [Bacteroidia bacterium]HRH62289.1 dehydrogenase [Bacteroidia bacterium]
MIVRSKAPLRLGLAGGGTDVSPYCDRFGGAILNATINLYAYASIEPTTEKIIQIESIDRKVNVSYPSDFVLPKDGKLELIKAVYEKVIRKFSLEPLSFKLSTYIDAPAGSGLGSSSTLVVAVLGAFTEWLKLPLGEYDIAQLAYEIERVDMKMAGGRQDQYSATFGGVNFMEFYNDDKVIVNPLKIKEQYLEELAHNLVLYYTETNRFSSDIIESQVKQVVSDNSTAIEATHQLKKQATLMKELLLKGDINQVGRILDFGWQNKKGLTHGITNEFIDKIYSTAIENGATGGKISGAGGGGFMVFYCPGNSRYKVIDSLQQFGGYEKKYSFTKEGLSSWTI